MKIPDGSLVAETDRPLAEVLKEYGHDFRGYIRVELGENGRSGEGFILMDDGNVLASAFATLGITLYQLNALEKMISFKDAQLKIYTYSDEEEMKVFDSYPDSVIGSLPPKPEPMPYVEAREEAPAPMPGPRPISYDAMLSTVIQLPGVIAAALVEDGLPIYQQGPQVDFEHIAVATEDMVRSGIKIATELQLGDTEQIILETSSNKAIIAPINDMFMCVLTAADANLGLIRLSIRNAQTSMRDE